MAIHIDPTLSSQELRAQLYAGDLVVLTQLPAVTKMVEHTRRQLEDLFAPHDPEDAHAHYTPAELAIMLGAWKPRFIHDEGSTQIVRDIVDQAGFAPTNTHYDVPKPRTSFPVGHLTTGIAFAFPWHRDVWYSAPAQQINWWLPIYPVRADNAMRFDAACFDRPVPNDSAAFDYYRHNVGRKTIATQVTIEVQARPSAPEHPTQAEVIMLPPPGSILMFSGAHLHATIPNTSGRSRYSVDFRTVDVDDLATGAGAPLVDVACTGTAIRDFRNVKNNRPFDEATIERLFGASPAEAMLVYEPGQL